ncbi:MAG: AAA family ATPase [Pseudomonadota bacterium]
MTTALPWAEGGAQRAFFEDAELHSIFSRSSSYLRAGVAVQFKGPSGMGKTAMALRVAHGLGRTVSFLTGHSRMTPEDLIGRQSGQHSTRLDDKYIASVRRTETRVRPDWQEGALYTAMTQGHTLVYDEFTRAPPEANVPLLSVLEEGVLAISHPAEGWQMVRAHPDFSVILTSNPADYQGTNEAPDALIDRVVTFEFSTLSEATEARIVDTATGLSWQDAQVIVALSRALKDHGDDRACGSIRTSLLIARLLDAEGIRATPSDPRFVQVCADVLRGRVKRKDTEALVRDFCADLADRPPHPLDATADQAQAEATRESQTP